jgi:hypothetical protein
MLKPALVQQQQQDVFNEAEHLGHDPICIGYSFQVLII